MYENLLRSYKTGLVPPINFYRTKIKEPVIITPIKSSSNLSIFLGCLFFCIVSCWLYSSGAFFACCRTCKVLISTQIISVQWVPIIIYSWNLPSFFDYFFFILWMKIGESISNKSFQIWRVSETRRLVSTLRLWPLISSPPKFGCVKPGSGTHVLGLGIQKLSTKILGCLSSPYSTW